MIEPPQPGFTGVVWPARPPERLARELTTGAGSVPMAEAVEAWTRLAASFGAAVVEYERAVVEIRDAWGSGRSNEVLRRVSTLRDWLVDAAAAATANAARFRAQVAAYEVARLTMPHTADIEQIQQTQQMLESVGGMLGAPIKAVAAETDKDSDIAKAVASRVMESYEKASEPLAMSWQQAEPPVIAPPAALAAEQTVAAAPGTPTSGGAPVAPMRAAVGPVSIPAAPPRAPSAYQASIYAQSGTTPEPVSQSNASAPAGTTTRGAPFAPGAMGGAANSAQEPPRFPRAGLSDAESDHLGAENELRAAPAVLGGAEAATAAPETRAGGEP